ncbi:type IV pilin protein [Herbaspirillum autotrophicum]|uniref:type IV pilin protein n=1 Tax=Herbaspirillum autotrophicum TaxID=180195 RepID=UPI0018DCFC95|nr:type IV pilin protein [Herbaspirillum autotrophicum]
MPVSAQRGFTLIELMIVISVLSLLLALAYPAYQSRLLHAKRAEGHAALLQVMLQQERHFSLNNRYRLFAGNSNETGFKWFSGNDPARSAYHVSGVDCDPPGLQQCIRLQAVPNGFADPVCGTLTLDSRGRRTAAATGGDAIPAACR